MFEEAYERCRTSPTEGIPFTVEDFDNAIGKYDFVTEIGTKSFQYQQVLGDEVSQVLNNKFHPEYTMQVSFSMMFLVFFCFLHELWVIILYLECLLTGFKY
ncbi:hypothetical protein AQUCO_07700002v1 [Aquilegia coerulea]|uniref:Uncharacterized protein n=1 Tax=Aquilegia coerulea TaxID=218851 RepID=A0A2G5C831_AQUCA|nr:hypothetical protein AQUCO_07700002v1 [Aquilegia coerulea]